MKHVGVNVSHPEEDAVTYIGGQGWARLTFLLGASQPHKDLQKIRAYLQILVKPSRGQEYEKNNKVIMHHHRTECSSELRVARLLSSHLC